MNLTRLGTFLNRWWWLLMLGVLLATTSTFYVSTRVLPKIYEARARILVTPQATATAGADFGTGLIGDQLSNTYSTLARTSSVLAVAAAQTPGLPYVELVRGLDVTVFPGTPFIDVVFRSADPDQAASVANSVASSAIQQAHAAQTERLAARRGRLTALVEQLSTALDDRMREARDVRAQSQPPASDQQLARAQVAVSQAQQDYANALANLDSLNLAAANSGDVLSLAVPAVAPLEPILPRVPVNIFVAGVVALVVALGVALLVDRLTDPLPSASDTWQRTGVPVLGAVEDMPHEIAAAFVTLADPLPRRGSESFRSLRATVTSVVAKNSGATLLVTSRTRGEGKTTIAAGLASAFALAGREVTLVDTNLRWPALNPLSTVAPALGISTLLAFDGISAWEALLPTKTDRLFLLAAGSTTADSTNLLASRRMRDRLDELRALTDVVILDGADVNHHDTQALASCVDLVLCVIDPRQTSVRALRKTTATLPESATAPLAVVMNHSSKKTAATVASGLADLRARFDEQTAISPVGPG